MCGFTCIVRRDAPGTFPDISPLDLKHRGPDYTGQVNHVRTSIRHWRLSIVDLSPESNQPVVSANKIFVFNGELYDYRQLAARFNVPARGDTATFFNVLQNAAGQEILLNAAGFFAYLEYDKDSETIRGGRDLLGKKPLYYYLDEHVAVFSSEESGILPFLPQHTLNRHALAQYLLYKNRFFGDTFFQGIREFAPGATFRFDTKQWQFSQSYDWDAYYRKPLRERMDKSRISFADNTNPRDAYKSQFFAAVARRFNCDVDVQLALSGGVDSTALATAIAADNMLKPKVSQAITVKFTGGLDESGKAAEVAKALGYRHKIIDFDSTSIIAKLRAAIRYFCAPLEHPHALAYFLMCEEVGKRDKVLITGEGADDLLFGYRHYDAYANKSFAFREFLGPESQGGFQWNDADFSFKKIAGYRNLGDLSALARSSAESSRDMELKTHLLSLLRRNDRMSMAHSVEIRSPFLDPAMLYMALSDDAGRLLKERKSFLREIIRSSLPGFQADTVKNGFYVPFDANFIRLRDSEEGRNIIFSALDCMEKNLGVIYKDPGQMPPDVGWLLLNIGIFAEEWL